MILTALAIAPTMLSPKQRSKGIALFGFTAVFGPVIGGYLTEAYSWHYAFFIDVPLGLDLLVQSPGKDRGPCNSNSNCAFGTVLE